MTPIFLCVQNRRKYLREQRTKMNQRILFDLATKHLLLHARRVDDALQIRTNEIQTDRLSIHDFLKLCTRASYIHLSRQKTIRICFRAVEKQLRVPFWSQKVINVVKSGLLCHKILEHRRAVIGPDMKSFLQLCSKPPVSFIHI